MTLPDQSNLVRCGKASDKFCYIFGKATGTAISRMHGAPWQAPWSCRHDTVLQVIHEDGSLSVARRMDDKQETS